MKGINYFYSALAALFTINIFTTWIVDAVAYIFGVNRRYQFPSDLVSDKMVVGVFILIIAFFAGLFHEAFTCESNEGGDDNKEKEEDDDDSNNDDDTSWGEVIITGEVLDLW